MGRINLYISDALEERMSGLKDHVNWSRVAQDAFERAINIESLRAEGKMDEAKLERIRASRDSTEEKRQASGHAAGREWALDRAEFEQLERVVSLDVGSIAGDFGEDALPLWLTSAVTGAESPDPDDVSDYMETFFGTTKPSRASIDGFIRGATEVYSEV